MRERTREAHNHNQPKQKLGLRKSVIHSKVARKMELRGDILEYAMRSADIRARCLTRKLGGGSVDFDDIRQDLLVNVIRAKYDEGRSSPKTFISRVMEKAGYKIIRRRVSEWRIVPLRQAE